MKNAQILVDACKNAGVPLTDDQIMVITGVMAVLGQNSGADFRVAYQEPLTHVGNSKFESWYEQYHIRLSKQGPKQIARDAYAAGMGEQARHMKGNG